MSSGTPGGISTAKEKLNELLGIESPEELVGALTVKPISTLTSEEAKKAIDELNTQTEIYKTDVSNFSIHTFESSLNELTGLIDISKQLITYIYDCVTSSNLIDPEALEALAKIIETARATTADYISVYKDKMQFYNTFRLEQMKQNHRKELLLLKHELNKDNDQNKDIDLVPYSQEAVVSAMKTFGEGSGTGTKPKSKRR